MEHVFREICEELEIHPERRNTSYFGEEKGITVLYQKEDDEMMCFERISRVSVIKRREVGDYFFHMLVPKREYESEVKKIETDPSRRRRELDLSNLVYRLLREVKPEEGYGCVRTELVDLEGVKVLIYNQMR